MKLIDYNVEQSRKCSFENLSLILNLNNLVNM